MNSIRNSPLNLLRKLLLQLLRNNRLSSSVRNAFSCILTWWGWVYLHIDVSPDKSRGEGKSIIGSFDLRSRAMSPQHFLVHAFAHRVALWRHLGLSRGLRLVQRSFELRLCFGGLGWHQWRC